MKRNELVLTALLSTFALVVGACVAETDRVDSEEDLSKAASSTLRLYGSPRTYRSIGEGNCDPFTKAALKIGNKIAEAQLETTSDVGCRVLIKKDPRSYRMRFLSQDMCGARTFQGTRELGGRTFALTLIDHRASRCDLLPPAAVELIEVDRTSQVTFKMYSSDRATARGQIALNEFGAPYLQVSPDLKMSLNPSLAGVDLRAGMPVKLKGTFLTLPLEGAPFPTFIVEASLPLQ
jgi:hypothetical protein